jgi:large subunit ribosomal protein L10
MHKVPEFKKAVVSQIVRNIEAYPIVGVVNMQNLPAPQLQRMRETLRDKVAISMTKKRLIKLALAKAKDKKPGVDVLEKYLVGMPALIFTRDNPFALFKILKQSKSNAPAKAGQIAPKDIVVEAGPTGFAPGPVIGELGAIGVKTMVEGGKISIRETTVVCREGKPISDKLAAMLTRLGIEPMEVGLDLVVTLEDGVLFDKKVLDIDEKAFISNLMSAHTDALGLAIGVCYTSKETIDLLLVKAFRQSKHLAVEAKILTSETLKDLVSQVVIEAKSLKNAANIEADETLPEKSQKDLREMAEVEDLAGRLLKKGTLRS